jgi:hypothetical protein
VKPSTDRCIGHQRLTSSGTSDVQTATVPKGTSHLGLAVETTNARVTFDGSDPSSGVGLPYYAGQLPVFIPLGQGSIPKFCSAVAGSSILQLAYYQ